MAGSGKFSLGNIFIRENRFNAGILPGFAGIHFCHAAMGDGAAQIFGHEHSGHIKIIGIARPARNFGHRIDPFDGLAYCHWK